MNKSLKEKAILIKGKKYVLVSDRVIHFNEKYENGCIQTKLISEPKDERVVIKAKIIPDIKNPDRYFTGHSQEIVGEGHINKTSALENAETSATGRALASMGIGVIDSIASADEMTKATNQSPQIAIDPNEPIPTCSICKKPMKKSKAGKFYCKHPEGWGQKVYPQNLSPKEQNFSDSMDEEINVDDINASIK